MRRVVVTGLGMISPIGNTVEESWENALAGKSGIAAVTHFDASAFGSRIAGEVKNFEVEKYLPAKEARRFDRFIQYGVAASLQALDDSGLQIDEETAVRAGCAVGSGIGGLETICVNNGSYLEKGPASNFAVPDSGQYCQYGCRSGFHYAQSQGTESCLFDGLHDRPAQYRRVRLAHPPR